MFFRPDITLINLLMRSLPHMSALCFLPRSFERRHVGVFFILPQTDGERENIWARFIDVSFHFQF